MRHFGNENRVKDRQLPPLKFPVERMEFNWRCVRKLYPIHDVEYDRLISREVFIPTRIPQLPPSSQQQSADASEKSECHDDVKVKRLPEASNKVRRARMLAQIQSVLRGK